jgi:hypothetical protein
MRSDMHKVIVERPRPRSGYSFRKGDPLRKIAQQELPAHESMKVRHADRRCFNENLNPLRRWLERQVGRRWDQVYSEACEVIKPSSTVKNHVKLHLLEFVCRDIVLFDALPHSIRRWMGGGYFELHTGDLYVHPSTGLLCSHRRRRVAKGSLPETARLLRELPMPEKEIVSLKLIVAKDERVVRRSLLRKLMGLWHEVEEYEVYRVDKNGEPMRILRLVPHDPARHIRIHSRQLNRRRLCQLGLKNGSKADLKPAF